MPLYEYHCTACGADLEVLHGLSEAPPKKCPECGKLKLVKQVSAAGFRLGGSGWYETDFKSDKDKKKNLVNEKSESSTSASSSDTPAAKTEAKAEPKPAKPAGGGKAAGSGKSGKTKAA